MKKLALGVVGGVCAVLLLFLIYARIFGYDPGLYRPGLWLKGQVVTEPVTDWSFARRVRNAAIQTHQSFFPLLAHSVTTALFHYKEQLYFISVYPAGLTLPSGRRWNENVKADSRVRIRLVGSDRLYDGNLVYVSDPAERDAVFYKQPGAGSYSLPGMYIHLWRFVPLQ